MLFERTRRAEDRTIIPDRTADGRAGRVFDVWKEWVGGGVTPELSRCREETKVEIVEMWGELQGRAEDRTIIPDRTADGRAGRVFDVWKEWVGGGVTPELSRCREETKVEIVEMWRWSTVTKKYRPTVTKKYRSMLSSPHRSMAKPPESY
ncbi:hypothetical protein F2Q70_00017438 [Brassica cretica]|uniref:Uncharacterized protein n=1 Tax=Brassica cretica TaxID=69181 RepID=A0A8S9HU36_BRACR|nr:hypothetical protein F2Q70_00017438 [Brassica cretica]